MSAGSLDFQLRVLADTRAALEELKRLKEEIEAGGDAADNASDQMHGLAGSVGAIAGAWISLSSAKAIIRIADDYGQMAARIQLATETAEEFTAVQTRLFESTKETYRSLSEAQETYIQTADALKSLGYGTQQVLDVTESLSLLFVTNATSSERATSAINAFSKALQTGRVDALSWQSLLLATPTLVDNIARATGQSAETVRKLGISGKLALTDLTEGLRLSLQENAAAAQSMQTSVSDALTRLATAWQRYIGEADKGGKYTGELVNAIEALTANLDKLIPIAAAAATALAVMWSGKAMAGLISYGKGLAELSRTAVSVAGVMNNAGNLAMSGWIGWEIGSYLYDEFEIARQAGLLITKTLLQYAAYVKWAWESALAVFSDATLADAAARFKAELAQIQEDTDALWDANKSENYKPKAQDAPAIEPATPFDASRLKQADDAPQKNTAPKRNDDAKRYVESLEKQAALLNLTADEVRRYEMAEKQLTGTLKARALAALDALKADEAQKQAAKQAQENARLNSQLQQDLLHAQGNAAEAALLRLRQAFAEQRAALIASGNEAGIALLDELIPLSEAQIRLDALKAQIERVLSEQSSAETQTANLRESGAINELTARQRLLEIHQATAAQLAEIRPELEAMSELGGAAGEAAEAALLQMDAQLSRLQSTCSLLEKTLSEGLESGLTQALSGLAKGTLDLRGAINALATSVAEAMLKMAAQNLAQTLTSKIMSAATGGGDLKSGAAAVTTSASALSAAGGTLVTGAAAIQSAAAALAAAGATSGAAGAAGGAAGAAGGMGGAMGWAGMAGSMAGSMLAKAAGGIVRGPGTGTSDSIPALLSNGEFVIREAVTRQPGMQQLLDDLNRRGLAALQSIKPVRHSTGGLAGMPAPAFGNPALASASLAAPQAPASEVTVNHEQTLVIAGMQDAMGEFIASSKGEAAIIQMMERSPQTFKTLLSG